MIEPSFDISRISTESLENIQDPTARSVIRDILDGVQKISDILVEVSVENSREADTRISIVERTGLVLLTLETSPPTGWIMFDDGTIGNGSSGASNRANADTEALFTLLWNNISDSWCPVSSGRGASAASDFAANKTITLPRTLGRVLGISGAGSGLTSRALGEYLGAETHTLVLSEIPAHTHGRNELALAAGGLAGVGRTGAITAQGESKGGDGAHNNMQPTSFLNAIVKL